MDYDNLNLIDLRVCPVSRFKSYLIFYLTREDRIEVVRVLYGGRGDIELLLVDATEPA